MVDGAHPRQSSFACRDPAVDQPWMVDQERRHAKAGGIAYAKTAANGRVKPHGGIRLGGPCQMFRKIDRKSADQPDREHFRLERPAELRALGPACAVGSPELSRTVDRGRAHQITDLVDHLIVRLDAA